jgi:hypothetical protein
MYMYMSFGLKPSTHDCIIDFLIDSFSLINFSNTMSTRKYAWGSEKRKKRKRVDELIESQRGAMDRFFSKKIQACLEIQMS